MTFAQPPQLFLNDGRGQFVDVSSLVGGGFETPIVARGIATADWDRDGDLDVVITTNGGPVRMLRNDVDHEGRTWVRLRLRGSPPNRDAVGAVARVFVGDRAQRFMVGTAGSYLSQSETNPVLAGLGGAPRADSVVVTWPRGGVSREGAIEAGTERVLREPPGAVAARR